MFNFALNIVFQFILVFHGNILSYEKQMFIFSICGVIIMALIPIVVIFIPGTFGFIMTSLMILLLGLSNSIYQSSMFGICGFLPFKFIIAASFGNGIAGIAMNLLRYIVAIIFGTGNDKATIVNGSLLFFGIAIFLLILGVIAIPILFNDPFFKANIFKSGEVPREELDEILNEYNVENKEDLLKIDTEEKQSNFFYIKKLISLIFDTNLCIFVTFLATFTVFPGLCFNLYLL